MNPFYQLSINNPNLVGVILGVDPPTYGLSNYQRWLRLYDASHEPKLGPEPTKAALIEAAGILKAEGRMYYAALFEAAGTVQM